MAEERILQSLNQARQPHPRAELHRILQQAGGVFALLNEPSRWQAQIAVALAELQAAKDAAVARRTLIRSCRSG